MQKLIGYVYKISRGLNLIAALMLASMILLTVTDVILRIAKTPIVGTYEIVGLLSAALIGFSIPFTSCIRGHIRVDFFLMLLPPDAIRIANITAKCLGIGLFFLIGWNIILFGIDLAQAGEVTPTRHIPFYPVLYGIGASCFFECIVLLCDIAKIFRRNYE